MRKLTIDVGDTVRYKAGFLRSVGIFTGDMPRACGVVTSIDRLGSTVSSLELATMNWGRWDMPERVNVANLEIRMKGKLGA